MSKPNKDGWIRHRGGKCPVEAGVKVKIRDRDGNIYECNGIDLRWSHIGRGGDIMAYRIYKPVEQLAPVSEPVERKCEGRACEMPDAESHSKECLLDAAIAQGWAGPIQWRDRITEIDRTVEALEEERVSLVQRLEGEGFALIGRVVQPVDDMSDCLNWKKGDKVMANDDSAGFGGGFHEGGIYVMREDCTNKDHIIRVVEDDDGVENGWGSKFFKFHSRPSK